ALGSFSDRTAPFYEAGVSQDRRIISLLQQGVQFSSRPSVGVSSDGDLTSECAFVSDGGTRDNLLYQVLLGRPGPRRDHGWLFDIGE
ncbi:hypothetical protein, partial [Parvibaculum sp.]|uniref:hypothetical protein n=1 Tax=Parvibaculum sp. TaxID=2024848 RepID=UPI0032972A6C